MSADSIDYGVDVVFVDGDAADPPYEASSCDVVVVRHVLWALEEPHRALARWRGLIRPGGRLVLVEGAGGLLVRIADEWTIADVAARLEAPLVVVTSVGLGSLNLAELSVEAARARGITVAGLIGGSVPPEPDLATRLNLEEFGVVTSTPYVASVLQGQARLADETAARALIAHLTGCGDTLGGR